VPRAHQRLKEKELLPVWLDVVLRGLKKKGGGQQEGVATGWVVRVCEKCHRGVRAVGSKAWKAYWVHGRGNED
jgi:hypothetical protein